MLRRFQRSEVKGQRYSEAKYTFAAEACISTGHLFALITVVNYPLSSSAVCRLVGTIRMHQIEIQFLALRSSWRTQTTQLALGDSTHLGFAKTRPPAYNIEKVCTSTIIGTLLDNPLSGVIYNFGRVCLSVCVYVCLSDDNFRKS